MTSSRTKSPPSESSRPESGKLTSAVQVAVEAWHLRVFTLLTVVVDELLRIVRNWEGGFGRVRNFE